jgi:hypothetical protein
MNARIPAVLLAAAVALSVPAGAQAMTVGVADGVLRVTGEGGERDLPNIEPAANKRVRFVQELDAEIGPGCNRVDADVYCNAESGIVVSLGDGNDELSMRAGLPAPIRYVGGRGRDLVRWTGIDSLGVAADNDGQADDGPLGLDDIEADVEIIHGSFVDDVLGSGSRGASINGRDGDDTVRGGSGRDRITAAYIATDGTEAGSLYSEGRDTISCGGGQDFVLHDLSDLVASDCEAFGGPSPDAGGGYVFGGSAGNDFMGAPAGWYPASMYPGPGNDTVQGPEDGHARAELGAGNDRFRGMGIVKGQSGDDFIDVQNGRTSDQVDCGGGRDGVIADRPDRVARNCERVTRVRVSLPR